MEAHRVSILRAYFARFGLSDPPTSRAAARLVMNEVLRTTVVGNDSELDRRLVAVARKWIRDFSESDYGPAQSASGDPVRNWFSRAPILLSKFPSAFLATPLPGSSI
jgi:hypothetical protein